jgi:hypothetical protein
MGHVPLDKRLILVLFLIAYIAGLTLAGFAGGWKGIIVYNLPVLLSFYRLPGFKFKNSIILGAFTLYIVVLCHVLGTFAGGLLGIHYLGLFMIKSALMEE